VESSAMMALPHPTPVHIHTAILDELAAYEKRRGNLASPAFPAEIYSIIRNGIRRACDEHNKSNLANLKVQI